MNIFNQFTQTLYTKRSLILNLIMNPMLIFLFQRISQVRKCSDVKKMVLLLKKKISDGTEMSESLNNAEKEYASVEDLLGMHRSVSNETAFFLRFQTYLMRKMLLLHQNKEKNIQF